MQMYHSRHLPVGGHGVVSGFCLLLHALLHWASGMTLRSRGAWLLGVEKDSVGLAAEVGCSLTPLTNILSLVRNAGCRCPSLPVLSLLLPVLHGQHSIASHWVLPTRQWAKCAGASPEACTVAQTSSREARFRLQQLSSLMMDRTKSPEENYRLRQNVVTDPLEGTREQLTKQTETGQPHPLKGKQLSQPHSPLGSMGQGDQDFKRIDSRWEMAELWVVEERKR